MPPPAATVPSAPTPPSIFVSVPDWPGLAIRTDGLIREHIGIIQGDIGVGDQNPSADRAIPAQHAAAFRHTPEYFDALQLDCHPCTGTADDLHDPVIPVRNPRLDYGAGWMVRRPR